MSKQQKENSFLKKRRSNQIAWSLSKKRKIYSLQNENHKIKSTKLADLKYKELKIRIRTNLNRQADDGMIGEKCDTKNNFEHRNGKREGGKCREDYRRIEVMSVGIEEGRSWISLNEMRKGVWNCYPHLNKCKDHPVFVCIYRLGKEKHSLQITIPAGL